MAVKQPVRPIRLQPKPKGLARVVQRRNIPTLALGAIAVALAILIFHDLFIPAATNLAGLLTATVATGTVTNTVTASGSLVPAQQLNLGFKTGGTLTEVDALSGQTVKAGQVLARIDPQPLQLALQQAEATLASAQAALASTSGGTSIQQATDAVNQASTAYTNAANTQAADQSTYNLDSGALAVAKSDYWYTQYGQAILQYQGDQNNAQLEWETIIPACTYSQAYTSGDPCYTAETDLMTAQNDIACTQGTAAPSVTCTFQQQQMASAYRAVNSAQGTLNADAQRVSLDSNQTQNALNALTNARDSYNSQVASRPATIQMEQAQVAAAASQVTTDQQNLDSTTLVAPIDGIVTSVNAQVGDAVAASAGGAGAEAPGSTTLLPTSSGGTGTGSGAGSTSFMTIVSDNAYQTVVSFAESDAARVQAGQVGQVTFDAISGLTVPVHVLAVAGAATVVSNVVNYYVTLTLDTTDPRLRPGMTTNATVVTAEADNVLTVENAAITHRGAAAFVTLLQGTRKVLTPITTGVVGTTATEIMSGLREGDIVVLPTVSTTTGAGLTNRGGGRIGGGGGAGLGLGG